VNDLITVLCTKCANRLTWFDEPFESESSHWICHQCGFRAAGRSSYVDLVGDMHEENKTASHYSLQWGEGFGFLDFIQKNVGVKNVLASAQLGWEQLFSRIRKSTESNIVYVYDAACGFGGIANEIITPTTTNNLVYVGADVHNALGLIPSRLSDLHRCGLLLRWDISLPLPIAEKFDYVLCRASLHHTPNPRHTFSVLSSSLKTGGEIAVSVYRKKSICREALDDTLRAIVTQMPPHEAFEVCRQFSVLGKALQEIQEKIIIREDLALLGIQKGEFSIHNLIYYYFLKCFYNEGFGYVYSTLVNYDWYHPPFAFRYKIEELTDWFKENGLKILDCISSDVQHYLVGMKL
jgi:SAM-dependent methyltransferase